MINRNNYEEYFLMLADKELSTEEEANVLQFAAQHPDLQEELDIILSCRLDAEPLPFFPKEKLLRTTVWNEEKLEPVQTQMLLMLDGELQPAAQMQLQTEIAANAALQKEWSTLQQAKLVAEAIAHPDKESLYRKESKLRPLMWMRWAAAAAVITGFGWMLWPAAKVAVNDTNLVAINQPTVTKTPSPISANTTTDAPDTQVNNGNDIEADTQPVSVADQQDVAVENKAPHRSAGNNSNAIASQQNAGVYTVGNTSENNFSKENRNTSNQIASSTLHLTDVNLEPVANKETLVIQMAHLTPKAISLPANNDVVKSSDVFTGKTASAMEEEEEEYITVGGAKIKKQKMRGVFRSVSRSVARSLSKSKLEPDVYATR